MFKYNLGQVVYYMVENALCSAPILARMIVENAHDEYACTSSQKDFFTPWGESRVMYKTCHGIYTENVIFDSKQKLVEICLNF